MAKKGNKTTKSKKAKPAKMLTTSEIAEELGIEARTLRVWLRSEKLGVGRGKRYKFTEAEAEDIVERYQASHDEAEDDETEEELDLSVEDDEEEDDDLEDEEDEEDDE